MKPIKVLKTFRIAALTLASVVLITGLCSCTAKNSGDIFVMGLSGNVPQGDIKIPTVSDFSGLGVHKIDNATTDEYGNVHLNITFTGKENLINIFEKAVDIIGLSKENSEPSFFYTAYPAGEDIENLKDPFSSTNIISIPSADRPGETREVEDRQLIVNIEKTQGIYKKVYTVRDFPEINVQYVKVHQPSIDFIPHFVTIGLYEGGAEELANAISLLNKRADIECAEYNGLFLNFM